MLGMPPLVGLPSQPPAEHSPNSSSIEKLPGSEGQDEREEEDKVQARSWLAPASSGLPPPSLPRSLPAAGSHWPRNIPSPGQLRSTPILLPAVSACQGRASGPLLLLPASGGQAQSRGVGRK